MWGPVAGRGVGRGMAAKRAALAAIVVLAGGCGGSARGHSAGESGKPLAGAVIRAVDGDTIDVRLGGTIERVRYIGIDTPETVKPGTPVQCFGHRASEYNARLVEGQRAQLTFGAERRDDYGRLLAYVHAGGRFVNAELVRRGYARTLEIEPNTGHARLFASLEHSAALAGRGLWHAC